MKWILIASIWMWNFAAFAEKPAKKATQAKSNPQKIIHIGSPSLIDIMNQKGPDLDALLAPSRRLEEEDSLKVGDLVDLTYGKPSKYFDMGAAVTADSSKYYYITGHSPSKANDRLYRLQHRGCSKQKLVKIIEEQNKTYKQSVPVKGRIRNLRATVKPSIGRSFEMFEINVEQIGMNHELNCKK
jgi:hypothetical protein